MTTGSIWLRAQIANINKNISESYSKEKAMGVRDIWGHYEGRNRTVSGGTGMVNVRRQKGLWCAWDGWVGEWMNLAAAAGSGGAYY